MIIDSHLHVNFRKLGARELISYMDREGIDMCWLLTWEEISPQTSDYIPLSVEDVFEAYNRYPSRVIPMYAPDPARPAALDRFKEWLKKGVRGFGELKVPLRWDSTELDTLLSCLNELGMPLVFHMEQGGLRYRPTVDSSLALMFARVMNSSRVSAFQKKIINEMVGAFGPLKKKMEGMRYFFPGYLLDFIALEARLKEYPHIKFIGHGPMFWKGISYSADVGSPAIPKGPVTGEGIICRLLSEYDNMYADLSASSGYAALTRDPGFAKRFLSEHSHKILYGTDNFFLGLRPFLDSLKLSMECYRRIYGENACGILDAGRSLPRQGVITESERLLLAG